MKRFAMLSGIGLAALAVYVVVTTKPGVSVGTHAKVAWDSYGPPAVGSIVVLSGLLAVVTS